MSKVKLALEQTKQNERIFSIFDFIWLWFGMTAQMGVFTLGASFAFRIDFWSAVAAILIGNFVVSIVLVLNGDPGSKYGVKFAVFLRAPFGYFGCKLPALVRAVGATFWFGIQTWFAATAINLAVRYFISFSTGQDSEFDQTLLFFILFGILQIFLTLMGVKWIKWLQNLAAPALFALSIFIIWKLIADAPNGWEDFANAPIGKDGRQPLSFWMALTANLSYWVTVAINISDFTRHIKNNPKDPFWKRNTVSIIGQMPAITIGMVVFIMVGMVGGVFTGNGNPVEIINACLGGHWVLLGLAIILLAQLSTNVPANLFATSNVLSSVFREYGLTYKKAVILAGCVGLLTCPWFVIEHFMTYLPIIGAFLAPLPGIMMTDYFLVRRAHLSVTNLFDFGGKYRYWHGVNPGAIIAYGLGVIVGALLLKYSWLAALPVAVVVYYILMKVWIEKAYPASCVEDPSEPILVESGEIEVEESISGKL